MKFSILINFLMIKSIFSNTVINYQINKLYSSDGDLKINFLLKDCSKHVAMESYLGRTLTNSVIWTIERLNLLQITAPFTLGLSVYQICNDTDVYNSLFHIFQEHEKGYQVGIISIEPFSRNLIEFCQALDIKTKYTHKYWKPLIRSSVELLSVLNWKENVTLVTQYKQIIGDFYKYSKRESICLRRMLNTEIHSISLSPESPTVIFAEKQLIETILEQLHSTPGDWKIVIIPLDGEVIDNLLPGSYIIQPTYGDIVYNFSKSPKIIPTPLFFDVVYPLTSYATEISQILVQNCNDTVLKLKCLRDKYKYTFDYHLYTHSSLVNYLKIEPLTTKFNYNIYKVGNVSLDAITKKKVVQPLSKILSYNLFDENFIEMDETIDITNLTNATSTNDCSKELNCMLTCLNYRGMQKEPVTFSAGIYLRSDSWVFAFISVSILGVIFCLAIILFILVRFLQKHIFEGNPTLTILLLIISIITYLSIIPFTLDGDVGMKEAIMSARSICVSLPFAATFSLLLSRAILLATISKEVGFMSHVAGTVQSFLSMFIFGVQCALSLQVVRHCEDTFHDLFIMYLLSYNIILLLMLLCLTPLIARSQRNYKEGRYFTIAAILITIAWCCWVPSYIFLGEDWKDPILCMGLISTASVLLGTLFIPRTYMMTVAAARDRFASALPSLATATSTLDIYRASTQPLYDCVNVATINALNVRNANNQNTIHRQQERNQQDFYSCPTAPENEYEVHSETATNPDKVTRF